MGAAFVSAYRMMLALFTGRRLSQTLPGLENFYMVGQWAGLPGVSTVAAMGRDIVSEICKRDGRHFVGDCRATSAKERASASADVALGGAFQTINAP